MTRTDLLVLCEAELLCPECGEMLDPEHVVLVRWRSQGRILCEVCHEDTPTGWPEDETTEERWSDG